MEPTSREQSARNSGGEETGRPPEQQDDHDDDDDDMITGPSYDCVFCKRGFTTAQALGGHMNIHRKDRAKAKPISPSSTTTLLIPPKKPAEKFLNSGFCLSILSYKPPNSAAPEAQIKYQEYILSSAPSSPSPSPSPSPSSAGRESNIDDHLRGAAVEEQKISKEDWRTCLSLQVGSSCGYGSNKEKGKKDDQKKEDELDLELRLGHNP